MPNETGPSATNWDIIFLKKLADVPFDAAKEFEENIREEDKESFQKQPENMRVFMVLLSTLSDQERIQLKEDLKMGKARNNMVGVHDLGNCIMLYEFFSGKKIPKKDSSI